MWGAAIGQAVSWGGDLLDDVLGLTSKKERRQLENQKELAQYQAQLNYDFNEKAAENAYERQMKMYERSYEDQSYSAMRKQMEDAGLSVGMMYGGAGSGGSGGATTGAPQGGGAAGPSAGAAPNAAQMEMAKAARAQNALGLMNLKADLDLKRAQKKEIEAQAEKARAEAGLHSEKKITEMQTRDKVVEALRLDNRLKWMQNVVYRIQTELPSDDVQVYGHKDFGTYRPNTGSLMFQRMIAEINETEANTMKSAAQAAEAGAGAEMNYAIAKLNNNKAEGYWTELQCMIINTAIKDKEANAALMQAYASQDRNSVMEHFARNDEIRTLAQKLTAEFQSGEKVTWKSILDGAISATEATAKVVAAIKGGVSINTGKPTVQQNPTPMTKTEINWRQLLDASRP